MSQETTTAEAEAPAYPQELKILAFSYLGLGVLALIQSLHSFFSADVPSINFLVIFLIIGLGLLRSHPLARSIAFYCALLVFAFYLACIVFKFFVDHPTNVIDSILFWIISTCAVGASGWAIFLLNRADVVRLFLQKK